VVVPPRKLDIIAKMGSRHLLEERDKDCSTSLPEGDFDPACAHLHVDVPLAILLYISPPDAETGDEYVYICAHSEHVDSDARPFAGEVSWCGGGSQRVANYSPVVLGGADCVEQCRSLKYKPDLPPDGSRKFESWWRDNFEGDENRTCQFQRLVDCPFVIGKISNAAE